MRTKLYRYLVISLLAIFGVAGFTSCGDDVTNEYYQGNILVNEYFTVKSNQWTWDDDLESYVYYAKVKALTDDVYYDGAVVASVIANPGPEDRLELLPYLFTYLAKDENGEWYTYTENVSCSYTPGNVIFYIQSSDRLKWEIKEDYEFRVSLIGDVTLFN